MQQSLSLPLTAPTFFCEIDQLAQRGARQVLYIAEVEQELLMSLVFHQAVELVTHFLNVLFGHDLGVDETDNRNPVDVFQAEVTTRGLRHRADSDPGSEPHSTWSRWVYFFN